jgi:hypothetical protein
MRRPKWLTPGTLLVLFALLLGAGVLSEISAPIASPDTKELKAHLGCQSLAYACEAYRDHERNEKHEFPRALGDLLHPPWGGSTFLKSGEADLVDPWGSQFQLEQREFADGTKFVLIRTKSPDGTPITQFGIGQNAEPRKMKKVGPVSLGDAANPRCRTGPTQSLPH